MQNRAMELLLSSQPRATCPWIDASVCNDRSPAYHGTRYRCRPNTKTQVRQIVRQSNIRVYILPLVYGCSSYRSQLLIIGSKRSARLACRQTRYHIMLLPSNTSHQDAYRYAPTRGLRQSRNGFRQLSSALPRNQRIAVGSPFNAGVRRSKCHVIGSLPELRL